MEGFNFFLPISKVEKTDDGARTVTGYASTPTLDLDGEIVSLSAVKSALPSYMEWRNIRQMHQPIAVGTAKEANVDDKGLYLTARIVDSNAIKLLDEEVLKGFSIGGRKLTKTGNTITSLELIEISLVDRPANPDCRIDSVKGAMKDITLYGPDEPKTASVEDEVSWYRKMIEKLVGPAVLAKAHDYDDEYYVELCKREFSDKERESAAASGEAMPGGGYPIKSEADVRNAVQAFGRAKNPEATKKHIIRRAKALGATHLLPADWEGSTKEKFVVSDSVKALLKASPSVFGTADIELPEPLAKSIVEVCQPLAVTSGGKGAIERIAKGCYILPDLAYAFSSLREAQRRLLVEGHIEKDGEDEALAHRVGQIAAELASIMAQKAEHEGSEALYYTDADDLLFFTYNGDIEMTLSDKTGDLAKRASKASLANLHKGMQHLQKAGKHHAAGMAAHQMAMGHLAKCTGLMGKGATLETLLKSEDAIKHLTSAHENFGKAAAHFDTAGDHMELAHSHLAKAAGGQEEPVDAGTSPASGSDGNDVTNAGPTFTHTGHVSSLDQHHLTEGEVPWYDADKPYPGKSAGVPAGFISKTEVEAMIKAAVADAGSKGKDEQIETLKALLMKTPVSTVRPRLSAFIDQANTRGGDADKDAALYAGLDEIRRDDPDASLKAANRIMSNMIGDRLSGGSKFAKSIFDPSFQGKGGVGKSN